MAAPTPSTHSTQTGRYIAKTFYGKWSDTSNWSAEKVIDVSALSGGFTNGVRIRKLIMVCTSGIGVKIEFDDDTTDEFVAKTPLGMTVPLVLDFAGHPNGLVYKGADGTGDVIATTTSAATDDEVFIYIEAEAF